MHVAIVSTFPPQQCGIATFSADLRGSLVGAPGVDEVSVLAVGDADHDYGDEVVAVVLKEVRADYVRAARLTGRLGVDVVMIEHEFGIFGGRSGEYLLSFTAELPVPYVVTLHTVLSDPEALQHAVLSEICRRAAGVTVFTELARGMVRSAGLVDDERLHVLPHGAPPAICAVSDPSGERRVIPVRGRAGVAPIDTRDRFVVSTFGLLSPDKGVENAIRAVARLVPSHPELLLVVAGRTHPEVARHSGEKYRLELQALVRELGIGPHVTFDDRFLDVDELAELLAATDVFVTAYRQPDQVVSGALTFAVAAGRPVVSTRYRYAEQLLSSGAGRLVEIDDVGGLTEALADFLDDPDELVAARRHSARIGADLSWPSVGRATSALLSDAVRLRRAPEAPPVEEQVLPPLRFDHLLTLVDDAGVVQHATGLVPDRATGYCVDDVARLAQVAFRLARRTNDERWTATTLRALAFLAHARQDGCAGGMHNFMSYGRSWTDEPHLGDHVGRAVWALGDVLTQDPEPSLAAPADELLDDLCHLLDAATDVSVRSACYALLGLAGSDIPARRRLADRFTGLLVDGFAAHAGPGWQWFEDALTYDNARLSQALILAGHRHGHDEALRIGLASLAWYGDECDVDGPVVRLPGHGGRHRDESHPGSGAEQPIDAAALAEAEIAALTTTGRPEHGLRALRAFNWFLGRNRLRLAVYDPASGGCRDGLEVGEVSLNEGAESTLVYWSVRLAIESAGIAVAPRLVRYG